tara:strand:+ start:864 stop:1298 length:435 start_codon:yes stop_codon:yes gene_type:complete
MAKFIFTKGAETTRGRLVWIAKDQAHIDNNCDWNLEVYDVVEVSQSDFDAVQQNLKNVIYDGTNVTYEDVYTDQDYNHEEQKDVVVAALDKWLENNSSKPFATNVNNYKNYLTSLDMSTVPVRETFEKYISDQGQEIVNVFELI